MPSAIVLQAESHSKPAGLFHPGLNPVHEYLHLHSGMSLDGLGDETLKRQGGSCMIGRPEPDVIDSWGLIFRHV